LIGVNGWLILSFEYVHLVPFAFTGTKKVEWLQFLLNHWKVWIFKNYFSRFIFQKKFAFTILLVTKLFKNTLTSNS